MAMNENLTMVGVTQKKRQKYLLSSMQHDARIENDNSERRPEATVFKSSQQKVLLTLETKCSRAIEQNQHSRDSQSLTACFNTA